MAGQRKQYDDATRAAVIAALMAGQRVDAVAKEYNVPRGTVRGWKSRLADPAVKLASDNPESVLGQALYDYVAENLKTLRSQVEVFGDKSWLRKQGAQEMGVLHGILTDKAVRLLEAMSSND